MTNHRCWWVRMWRTLERNGRILVRAEEGREVHRLLGNFVKLSNELFNSRATVSWLVVIITDYACKNKRKKQLERQPTQKSLGIFACASTSCDTLGTRTSAPRRTRIECADWGCAVAHKYFRSVNTNKALRLSKESASEIAAIIDLLHWRCQCYSTIGCDRSFSHRAAVECRERFEATILIL
jgi:hypothetical protein